MCESGCSYSRGGGWLRPFISDFIQHQQSQTHSLDSKLHMSMFVGQNVLFSGNSTPQTALHINQAYLCSLCKTYSSQATQRLKRSLTSTKRTSVRYSSQATQRLKRSFTSTKRTFVRWAKRTLPRQLNASNGPSHQPIVPLFVGQNVLFSGNSTPQTTLHINQAYLLSLYVLLCCENSALIECTTAHCVRKPMYPYGVVCLTNQLCVRRSAGSNDSSVGHH